MKSWVRNSLWIMAFVVVQTLAMGASDSALAQRGGRGMRGFLTVDKFRIAQAEKVQEALEIEDEVKEKFAELQESAREKMMEARDENRDDFEAMGKAMEEISAEVAKESAELLTEKQAKRLQEIYLQVNGAIALVDKDVAKSLKLEGKQTEELESIIEDSQGGLRELFGQFRDMEPEERQETMAKWQSERDEKLLKVLTEEQQKAFEEAKGEKFEFDAADFRPTRGNRGGGGRGGRGGRGQGGRGQGGGRGQDF